MFVCISRQWHHSLTDNKMAARICIELPSVTSDGDSRKWPGSPYISGNNADTAVYLDKLADMWMSDCNAANGSQ